MKPKGLSVVTKSGARIVINFEQAGMMWEYETTPEYVDLRWKEMGTVTGFKFDHQTAKRILDAYARYVEGTL